MPTYVTENDGMPTNADDPNRFVFYSANCKFWTDDTDQLSETPGGIPCCPRCGSPGFQTTYGKWIKGAGDYEKSHPGYLKQLSAHKNKCNGHKRPRPPYRFA